MNKIQHDKIEILDDRQQARDKVSIWFGSKENFYHPVKEIIANSCDEIMNNFDKGEVIVTLSDNNKTISIEDTGRGIPLTGKTDNIPNYDVLFRKLFAGTKYTKKDNLDNQKDNKATTGTNGVGMAVVCMTSNVFNVVSSYNGKSYSIDFKEGGLKDTGLKVEKTDKDKHGTKITFELDPTVYTDTVFDKKIIEEIIDSFAIASSNKNINFILNYKDTSKEIKYNSLKEYFDTLIANQSTSTIIHSPSQKSKDDGELTEVEIVLTTQPENQHKTFLNLTYLSEGGSIHNGIVYGIREYCSEYCKENKLFKGKVDRFMPTDIENSVTFIVNVFSNNVEFNNQTKLSTGKQLYREVVLNQTKVLLDHFKNTDKQNFDKFIKHLLTVQQHNSKNQRATRKLRDELTKKIQPINNRVDKLIDCKFHNEDSELFIAEGDSAKGALVSARNSNNQAIYPIRGKILNCIDSTEQKILKNQIVTDLIKVIGTGIVSNNKRLNSFDIENMRYGKIVIATDQDFDGFHISTLLIGMIYRLMPELLIKGKVFLAQTPLYEIQFPNDDVIYISDEQEMKHYEKELKGKKYKIARAKGLGELNAEVLSETAMNPETRTMIQVNVEDLEELGVYLDTWLGKEVDDRRDFIEDNLDKYVVEVD